MTANDNRQHLAAARLAHRQGRLADAIERYRRWLDVEPADAAACGELGAALLQAGQLDAAEQALRRALQLEPDRAVPRCNLGNVLQQQGRNEAAGAELTRALELDPALTVAHYNLGNVRAAQSDWLAAVDAFRRALATDPQHGPSWFNLGHALHQAGRLDDAVDAYRRACAAQPDDRRALGNLGSALMELNRAAEAAEVYERALVLYPGNALLEHDRRAALHRQLPAWHLPMLLDDVRNDAFRRALDKVVDRSSRVLDIGTGSGLLAMMAARAGAASVTACEMLPAVADAARQVVADNGYAGIVSIVARKSTALRVGTDLREPATVLVSEIVDAGLLGEGVLPTVRHALRHLVTAQAAVIPRAATVFAALVEVPRLRPINPVREISGFDLTAFDRFRIPGDYVEVRLDHEPHRRLCEPVRVIDFDFRRPPPCRDDAAPERHDIEMAVTADGTAHAVAFWFDLALDDAITISTAPGASATAWGQALQFLDEAPRVRAGQTMMLEMWVSDTRIAFRFGP